MSIAISEEHRALAQTVAGLLTKHQSRAAARSLLEGGTEQLPAFWAELSGLGLLIQFRAPAPGDPTPAPKAPPAPNSSAGTRSRPALPVPTRGGHSFLAPREPT